MCARDDQQKRKCQKTKKKKPKTKNQKEKKRKEKKRKEKKRKEKKRKENKRKQNKRKEKKRKEKKRKEKKRKEKKRKEKKRKEKKIPRSSPAVPNPHLDVVEHVAGAEGQLKALEVEARVGRRVAPPAVHAVVRGGRVLDVSTVVRRASTFAFVFFAFFRAAFCFLRARVGGDELAVVEGVGALDRAAPLRSGTS
jgi:hypothetical protein